MLNSITQSVEDTGYLSRGRFTSSFQDSLTGLLSDTEGTDSHLGDLKDSDVIGDSAHNNSNLVSITSLLHVPGKSGNGQRWSVDLAHEEPPEDDLVELSLRPPGQEPVELDQQSQVDILGLGLSSANLSVILVFDINTHDVFCNITNNINILNITDKSPIYIFHSLQTLILSQIKSLD